MAHPRTTRALGAGSSASGGQKATRAGERTPYVQQLDRIQSTRQLSAAQASGARALAAEGAAQEASAEERASAEEAEEEARKAREARLAAEARELLTEAVGSVEAWVRDAAAAQRGGGEVDTAPPDWELLGQRARLVGGTLGEALTDGLALVRQDFEAYQGLQQGGNMPSLVEELQGAVDEVGRKKGRLRSFAKQETPAEQRAAIQKRLCRSETPSAPRS